MVATRPPGQASQPAAAPQQVAAAPAVALPLTDAGALAPTALADAALDAPPPPAGLVWRRIPGGCFDMGSNDGDVSEKPVHRVCVPDFEMAETEVTNAQYEACVRAGRCTAINYDKCYNPRHVKWSA